MSRRRNHDAGVKARGALEAVKGDRFVLLDPAVGRRTVTRAELGKALTGLVLVMVPGESCMFVASSETSPKPSA